MYIKIVAVLIFPIIEYYIRKFHIKEVVDEDVKRYKEEGEVERVSKITVAELFVRGDICFRDIFYYRCHQKCYLLKLFYKRYPNLYITCESAAGGGIFLPSPICNLY